METCPGSMARRVDYALPARAADEVREYFRRDATMECAAEVIGRIPHGRVFGPGHVLSPDGRAIARDVSLDFGKSPSDHWLLNYQKIPRPVPLGGTVAVIATTLGHGYCHWLLEEVPRLLKLGRAAMDMTKIIGHGGALFGREMLALHGWQGQWIEPGRRSHYDCEQLVVPNLAGIDGRPTPEEVDRIVDFVAPLRDAGASPWGEKIYVTRERARRRRVKNEAEVWAQLAPRGFAKVRLEEMTWREQIQAFGAAKIVVAPHGAGLANVIFCRPSATVVEVFGRGFVNGLFWQLSVMNHLDYRPMVEPGAEPLAQTPACGREDISVDIAQLTQALV